MSAITETFLSKQAEYYPDIKDDTVALMKKIISDAMENQPVINIGMIGHVSNGKSTLTKSVTGTATQRHTSEKVQNISIRLGYANAKFYKCDICSAPECYQSTPSSVFEHECIHCKSPTRLVLHVSFTDVPGHNDLMSTMLNGTCVMDCTILVESTANVIMPAPQTIEHYNITKKAGIPTKLVCLNKVELENKTQKRAFDMITNLRNFLTNHGDVNIPIIPVSGAMNLNIDVLCQYISLLEIPKKNLTDDFKMLIIRSFNINTPNTEIAHLKGGVVGGSLARGVVNIGQNVVIYPGYRTKKSEQAINESGVVWQYRPLKCNVISIKSDENILGYAIPGGLIGIQLNIDPAMTGDNRLVGQVMFREEKPSNEFKIFEGIKVKYTKLDEKIETTGPKQIEQKIKVNDQLQINVNSNNIKCTVFEIPNDDELLLDLETPICVEIGDHVTINISTTIKGGINILGHGHIIDGVECELLNV